MNQRTGTDVIQRCPGNPLISLAAAVVMIFALTPALVRLARRCGGEKLTPP